MTLHPFAVEDVLTLRNWHLKTASFRLPANEPLAQFKNCNKLTQVMARAEADQAGADEALLINTDGFVVEGASSNLFWIQNGTLCTPPLASGVLSGVTRLVVLELCQELGVETRQSNITREELLQTDGVFVSLSSFGIVQGVTLDKQPLPSAELTRSLHSAYAARVRHEVGGA